MKKTINIERISVSKTCSEADDLFKKWNVSEDDNYDLVLALDEVLTNIHEHGYSARATNERPVTIEIFQGAEKKIYLIITDFAVNFTLDQIDPPQRNNYVKSKIIGGFGIAIIKKIMDDLRHFQLFDENIMILGKKVKYHSHTKNRTSAQNSRTFVEDDTLLTIS